MFPNNQDCIDFVITDQIIFGMTGVDFSKKLFAIKPDVLMILASGFSMPSIQEVIADAGIRAFIMKPVLKQETAALLLEILDDRGDSAMRK